MGAPVGRALTAARRGQLERRQVEELTNRDARSPRQGRIYMIIFLKSTPWAKDTSVLDRLTTWGQRKSVHDLDVHVPPPVTSSITCAAPRRETVVPGPPPHANVPTAHPDRRRRHYPPTAQHVSTGRARAAAQSHPIRPSIHLISLSPPPRDRGPTLWTATTTPIMTLAMLSS